MVFVCLCYVVTDDDVFCVLFLCSFGAEMKNIDAHLYLSLMLMHTWVNMLNCCCLKLTAVSPHWLPKICLRVLLAFTCSISIHARDSHADSAICSTSPSRSVSNFHFPARRPQFLIPAQTRDPIAGRDGIVQRQIVPDQASELCVLGGELRHQPTATEIMIAIFT